MSIANRTAAARTAAIVVAALAITGFFAVPFAACPEREGSGALVIAVGPDAPSVEVCRACLRYRWQWGGSNGLSVEFVLYFRSQT